MEATYDRIGRLYRRHRRPDPRIAARIDRALGDAVTVVNVGAGTGSYEPGGRRVIAVEPSGVMVAQRPAGAAPAVRAVAEALPFIDGRFDAALAVLTVHHWHDRVAGLREMRRVSRRQVVFCFDGLINQTQWLVTDYLPEIRDMYERAPAPAWIADVLGGIGVPTRVEAVPVPADCTDGFQNAYWRRPEAYLDPEVQACISSLAVLDRDIVDRGLGRLA
ncbi:MAG: class I SAM-dependent methyltransferase, partial [Acidimicrobiales bacterium]